MTTPSPLASPNAWDLVAENYTTDLLPVFSLYAQDALDLAQFPESAEVLDVAAGPGTLSFLAAEKARRVTAVDFSETMVEILKRRAKEFGVTNLEASSADGQALPFEANRFDAAFSMFGLMFFPDRNAGFKELHRVLKPGGRAVVSSWAPLSEAPLLEGVFDCLRNHLPELVFGSSAPPPLSDPEGFRTEMLEAGFASVDIKIVKHQLDIPSIEDFWASQERASAPIVLLRNRLGEAAWSEISAKVLAELQSRYGKGSLSLAWPARLGVGQK